MGQIFVQISHPKRKLRIPTVKIQKRKFENYLSYHRAIVNREHRYRNEAALAQCTARKFARNCYLSNKM